MDIRWNLALLERWVMRDLRRDLRWDIDFFYDLDYQADGLAFILIHFPSKKSYSMVIFPIFTFVWSSLTTFWNAILRS